MRLSDFRYNLPFELIANHPSKNRDECRLMVINRKDGTIEHKVFKDIINYFNENDVFVLNNTKVFPARLYGTKEKTGAKIEVFLLRELNHEMKLWDVLVDPARKIRIGNKIYFGDDESLEAEVIDNTTSRGRTIRFLFDGTYDEFKKTIELLGHTPLPKLIKRPSEPEDRERYQTIFAKHEGAVAAPTAGLHFTRELMKRLEIKGVNFAEITLHAGLGNFRSIDVEDLSKHKMDSEQVIVSPKACDIINEAKRKKLNVCAVGTTSLKALETALSINGMVAPFDGWTSKFIFPPYDYTVATKVVTNFHLPQSSLMIMIAAFTGFDLLIKAYNEAVREKYQFFTYGDAMLVL